MAGETIDTSEEGWASKLTNAYKSQADFTFRDGAKLGIDLTVQSLWSILTKSGLNGAQISAVLLALGVTGFGVRLIRLALLDPEPISRVALTGIGAAMTIFGSGSALYVLTGLKPKTVKVTATGFEVSFHE